jgi:hypothetical protein
VFHCINRGVGRNRLFHKPQDYAAFERVMAPRKKGRKRMPFTLVVSPRCDCTY